MEAQNSNLKTQGLVSVSANTAAGNMEQLKKSVNTALDGGLTLNEIKEAMVQLYAYCGFPRSLNALTVLKEVSDDRKKSGKTDREGEAGEVENSATDRYEQGRKTLEVLTGTPQPRPAPGFGELAPRIDSFLKEHLFADIFANQALSYMQREIVTIAALASMDGTEAQLKAHIQMGKNTGITIEELNAAAQVIEEQVGTAHANILRRAAGVQERPEQQPDMLVRIAEVDVFPQYVAEYLEFARQIAKNSVDNEPGVISVFPMQEKEDPTKIRIMEIYKDRKAYDSHIASDNFQKYKTSTPQMIRSLRLLDMNMIMPENLPKIFKKAK